MYEFGGKKKDEGVTLDELMFYFDAQAKDRYDQGVLGRRNGQVLALREKLLSLPEGEFDMAIKTIEKLVADAPQKSLTLENKQRAEQQRQARTLYEKVGTGAHGGTASAPEKVNKV